MMDKKGIEFEVLYWDNDLIEFKCSASNANFCGETRFYDPYVDMNEIVKKLSGFPKSPHDDTLEIALGNFDSSAGGGGVKLDFKCIGSRGNVVLTVYIRTDVNNETNDSETVLMLIPLDPSAIDKFVKEVKDINENLKVGKTAYLKMSDDYTPPR